MSIFGGAFNKFAWWIHRDALVILCNFFAFLTLLFSEFNSIRSNWRVVLLVRLDEFVSEFQRCTELGYSDGRGKTKFRFLIFSLFTSQFSNLKLPNHCDQAIASSNHSLFAVVSHFETQSAAFLHLSLELSEKWRAGTYQPALHSVESSPELFRESPESLPTEPHKSSVSHSL